MIIYKATNLINNKIYVGKTIFNLKQRKQRHIFDAISRNNKTIFQKALCKYGENNFSWEIIDKCLFSESLIELEKYYIEKYKSKTPHGYNMTDGGEGTCGHRHTEESKQKMRLADGGKPKSREHVERVRIALTGRKLSESCKNKLSMAKLGSRNPNYGKKLSKEYRDKISASLKKYHAKTTALI